MFIEISDKKCLINMESVKRIYVEYDDFYDVWVVKADDYVIDKYTFKQAAVDAYTELKCMLRLSNKLYGQI